MKGSHVSILMWGSEKDRRGPQGQLLNKIGATAAGKILRLGCLMG